MVVVFAAAAAPARADDATTHACSRSTGMKVGARRPPTPRVARGGPLLADRDGLQVGLVVPATTPPQDAAKRAAVRARY